MSHPEPKELSKEQQEKLQTCRFCGMKVWSIWEHYYNSTFQAPYCGSKYMDDLDEDSRRSFAEQQRKTVKGEP